MSRPARGPRPAEKLGQLALFVAAIAAIYLFFRFAVVIPPAGFVAINVAAVLTVAMMMWRFRKTSRADHATDAPAALVPSLFKMLMALLLVLGLTLPIWVVLYFVWLGGRLWR